MIATTFLVAATLLPPGALQAHGFDYQFGTWRVHVERLLRPASASPRWTHYDGTHVVTPLIPGTANIGVLEIRGPEGSVEGLQLRAYDRSSGQWKLAFASGTNGEVQPASIGRFENGTGVFFDNTTLAGRPARERSVTTRLSETTYRDVTSYSTDGSTWHPFWIASYVKTSDREPQQATGAEAPESVSDFDFQIGTWHVDMRRLVKRLAGSRDWRSYEGTFFLRRLWNGRANVGVLDVHDRADRFQAIVLRTYDSQLRQWSDYSVDMASGSVLLPPTVGRFSNGRGELYDRETFAGREIVVRYVFDDIASRSCRFVQSFSANNGKTWEPNAVVLFTRTQTQ